MREADSDLWRGLEDLQERAPGSDAMRSTAQAVQDVTLERRNFLGLMAASLSLAGAGACSRAPEQTIVPYVRRPSQLTAGDPLYFATAVSLGAEAIGLLVKSNMGRPTKVEGNPSHPGSQGATDVFAQASVLDLWDPDRSQAVTHRGQVSTWEAFVSALSERINSLASGAGLRILTESATSPTLVDQIAELLRRFPEARWHQYQPINRDNVYEGARIAFGELVEPRYRFDRARVVLSLDSDFLGARGVRCARDFVAARRGADGQPDPARLYVVESTPTLTGAFADHRFSARFSDIEAVARAVARSLGMALGSEASAMPSVAIEACVADLKQHAGRCLVVAGDRQPPIVHALAYAMNQALGNVGWTVSYATPLLAQPESQTESLRSLAADMGAGRVDTLLILGGNPVYNAPADLEFGDRLGKVGLSVHLSCYDDETSASCRWHLPQAHYLESWSDVRAFDGTVSIQQPLIAPLYGGRSAHQVLALLSASTTSSDYDAVRSYWARQHAGADFEAFWNSALQRGVVEGSELPTRTVGLRPSFMQAPVAASAAASGVDLVFVEDPAVWDGRFANNGWLQELPRPLSKLTWDNAALVSSRLAQSLDLANEDLVEIRYRGATVTAPVWIMPGHPDQSVTIALGYGRSRAGRVGNGVGFNAYLLRRSDEPWCGRGAQIRKTGRTHRLAATQHHFTMEGRHPVRSTSVQSFRHDPSGFLREEREANPSMYEPMRYEGYAWAMSVDLDACIGCAACTIACQAENNIPVVGRHEVRRGREMHWIRVDRYYQGDPERPRTLFQPVPCMHCERAPCEAVCPVEATVHDSEGLNLQVYNRCVGTRFCSNNCPYKVRRFNFLQYSDEETESLKGQRNPDVTVRMRGVMEKCTYCVQRITAARIEAEKADRRLRDGEVVTACQAVCPTGAIVFGDLNDPGSRVNRAKASALNYALLGELNTRPRTTYLAKLSNPNPDLEQT